MPRFEGISTAVRETLVAVGWLAEYERVTE